MHGQQNVKKKKKLKCRRIYKLIKYEIVVFDEVYILFDFNIIITTGCPPLKKKYRH